MRYFRKFVFNSTLPPFIRSLAIHRAYSCIFHPCDLLSHFPLLHFLPLRSAPVFSTPAFSTPAILPVSHFPLLHFQSPLFVISNAMSTKINKLDMHLTRRPTVFNKVHVTCLLTWLSQASINLSTEDHRIVT